MRSDWNVNGERIALRKKRTRSRGLYLPKEKSPRGNGPKGRIIAGNRWPPVVRKVEEKGNLKKGGERRGSSSWGGVVGFVGFSCTGVVGCVIVYLVA